MMPLSPSVPRAARSIELRGVRVHNLKHIDLDIPLGKLVVLTGVSGSGKSSLAFDTIFAEGQRRYIESFSPSTRQYLERIERPNADRIAHVPPTIAIRTEFSSSIGNSTVASLAEIDTGLRRLFARMGQVICSGCGIEIRSQSADDVVRTVTSLAAGTRIQLCFVPTEIQSGTWQARGFTRAILGEQSRSLDELSNDDLPSAWIVIDRLVAGKATAERIAESAESAFREGGGRCLMLVETTSLTADSSQTCNVDGHDWRTERFSRHWECPTCQREFLPPEPRLFEPDYNHGCPACADQATEACPDCHGTRLCPEALAVQVNGRNIAEVLRLTINQAQEFISAIAPDGTSAVLSHGPHHEVSQRLQFVAELALGHLTLLRRASTLTGGQIRRLLLAATQGSRITGTLCLVDEPSAGLHPSEIPRVLQALRRLLDRRNSVIVVDHTREIIRAADHVIDLGPGAGPQGGSVVFSGPIEKLLTVNESATAIALRSNATAKKRSPRQPSDWLTLTGITGRNLKDITLQLPLGVLCVVSGPGGSGKTTLIAEALVPVLRHRIDPNSVNSDVVQFTSLQGGDSLVDVAVVDRAPLTRSSRSNAATWLEIFDEIRDVFALSPESRQRGFGAQHFSFNAAQGGRCRACRGTGILRHDMQFLPDVTLPCPECGGSRYRREILDVKYRGRSIADVLAMSAAEAAVFFRNHPRLQARLQMLKQIGLDYLVLGQPTDTLSGGEAQRLRLAARLTTGRGPTLIVCDEATVGLHPADVTRLIACFDELLGIGHSIVVIDNSPDLISAADHVIELGPTAGENGSQIVSAGPPV